MIDIINKDIYFFTDDFYKIKSKIFELKYSFCTDGSNTLYIKFILSNKKYDISVHPDFKYIQEIGKDCYVYDQNKKRELDGFFINVGELVKNIGHSIYRNDGAKYQEGQAIVDKRYWEIIGENIMVKKKNNYNKN